MEQENLRALLEQLHRELAANPPTDDRSRQLLGEIQADIERAMAPADGSGHSLAAPVPAPHNLRERLQDAIAGFEGAHPQSAALERVMVLLSNFGL